MANEIVTVQERLALQLLRQQEAAQSLRSNGSFISFKGANLKIDGVPIPNNMADVRVFAIVKERTYYSGEFDADEIQVPACYALDSDTPHELAAEPQSDTCADCPHNKWGSSPRGRGKACREGARLIVGPAGSAIKTAAMYSAKIPVTSLSAVTAFAARCGQANKLTGEFVTTLSVVEDKKSFFKVHLNIKELNTDLDMEELMAKQDQAYELAMQPYPTLEE